jgi:hypothetical protein
MKAKSGDIIECVHSASVGYTVGKTYEVYRNSKENLCIQGDDGFEDLLCMLISEFKKVKPNEGSS